MVAEALHAIGELRYGVNNTGIGGEFGSAIDGLLRGPF